MYNGTTKHALNEFPGKDQFLARFNNSLTYTIRVALSAVTNLAYVITTTQET